MRKQLIVMVFGFTVLSGASLAHAQASFPTRSGNYAAYMARAMDSCTPSGLTVSNSVTLGVPNTGCLQANSVTDSMLTMKYARVVVSRRSGKVSLVGHGFPPGARVKVVLNLRITRKGLTTKSPPGSFKTVTFQDITATCPAELFQFTANSRGGIAGSSTLAACLGASAGLVSPATAGTPPVANIEILSAVLVNPDNGNKVVARPGILR